MIKRYGDEKWIIGSCQCSIFEASWYLRGLDNFLMDLAMDEEYTRNRITSYNVCYTKLLRKRLEELLATAVSDSPLAILRKLKEIDTK